MSNLNNPNLGVLGFVQRYGLQTFVETGCYTGAGLRFARDLGIRNLYSCDLNEQCVVTARAAVSDARVYHEDSLSFLRRIVPFMASPTLFWLDAHFPEDYGVAETHETRYPVLQELRYLRDHKAGIERDVILCDDMQVIRDSENPAFDVTISKKYWFIDDVSFSAITGVMASTHDWEIRDAFEPWSLACYGEKVLVLTPKV